MNGSKKRRIRIDRIIIFIIGVLLTSYLCFLLISKLFIGVKNVIVKETFYVASDKYTAPLYDMEFNKISELTRGKEVIISLDKTTNNEEEYYKVNYQGNDYYIKVSSLVKDKKDIVQEKDMYVKISSTIYKDSDTGKIASFVAKDNKVTVVGYDKINDDGSVNMYQINHKDETGYVYSKYLSFDEENIINEYDKYHENRDFYYDLYGGSGDDLDYTYREKPVFENNIMPEDARTLYVNGWVLSNIDSYINIAKNNNINAFVIDIKDGFMAYESEVAKNYSISNYNSSYNTKEKYKEVIQKLKDEGFYVIGRIVAFNDKLFAKDNPSESIVSSSLENTSWVSVYSRLAWEFNVELAKEAVIEFGFNEIQFDYVRFPEASYSYSKNNYNFKNKYNEEKAQAIQNFLMYATDEIHKLNAYVSADVFGECSNTYVTAYGQYWPAISNVVDVISSMPYPDHFAKGAYGLSIPWEHPYELMYNWAKGAVKRQTEIPTPAKVRTWIQAYDAIFAPYITYDADMISKQISGLYDAGLKGGYITWNGNSSISKYQAIAQAFRKEY